MSWWRPTLALLALVCGGDSVLAETSELDAVRQSAAGGQTAAALDRLEPILVQRPDDLEVLLLKGVLLADLGRTEEAERVFLELIEREPGLPEPYNNLAAMYGAAGEYDQAIEVLKLALHTHSSYETAYENLNRIYGRLASEAYKRALGGPTSPEAEAVELMLLTEIKPRSSSSSPAKSPDPGERSPAGPISGGSSHVAEASAADASDADSPVVESGTPESETFEPDTGRLAEVVQSWATSWSAGAVEEHLSYYSADFEPTGELSRPAWEAMRRQWLAEPDSFKVSITLLEVVESAPDRAAVRFNQSDESDRFRNVVTKTLELVWEEGSWRIVREQVEE